MKQDEYREFMIKRIGIVKLDALENLKNGTTKITDVELEELYNTLK